MTHNIIAAVVLGVSILGAAFFVSGRDIVVSTWDKAAFGTIQVSGDGSAKIVPDVVVLRAGSELNEVATQEAAYEKMNQSVNAIKSILKKAGIEDTKIQTANISVSKDYNYSSEGRQENGYRASQSLTIRFEKQEDTTVNTVMDQIAKVPNINIQGTSYETLDPEVTYSQARKNALEKARQKADEIAEASNVKIIKVLSVSEGSNNNHQPMYTNMKTMNMVESVWGGMDISKGEMEYWVQVQVTYEIQ